MVVRGFLGQLVEKIDLPELREQVRDAIDVELESERASGAAGAAEQAVRVASEEPRATIEQELDR